MQDQNILFRDALQNGDLHKLKEIPKADLHNHSVLGMRLATFNKTFGINVTPPPKRIDGLRALDEYAFTQLAPHITTAEQLIQLLELTLLEAISDGIKIVESSIDTNWLFFFDSNDACFSAIRSVQDKFLDAIDFRPELGIGKNMTADRMEDVLITCIDSGIFKSIDLYGDETIDDFDKFKPYFIHAKNSGLKLKAHAGEFHGPGNVKKAIDILDLDEVQHGITIADSDYLLDLVKDRGIRLNICPSSNVILGAVSDMKSHPIGKLFDKDINLSINTDDLLVFNQGVSDEYFNLYNSGVLGVDELNEIRKMSLK